MLESKAYTVQMNVDVPDAERRVAEKAEEYFESLLSQLKLAVEHLDLIYIPFAKRKSLDNDEVVENRVILRKYRDKVHDNFQSLFKTGYNGVALMGEFSSDSAVGELMTSFIASLRQLEKQVNYLLSIFSNLNNPDFRDQLISSIDSVKKQASQLKQLVNDRVLEHIETNILAKNWENLVNEKADEQIKNKEPLIVQLYRERQNAVK